MAEDTERTAALMTPAKLAQMRQDPHASAAGWLDQVEAGAAQVDPQRLRELLVRLRSQVDERETQSVRSALSRVLQELPRLDFSLLQPMGWLARATGKARSAGVEFAALYDQIGQAMAQFRDQSGGVARQQQAQASACERILVELDVELRAIDTLQEQVGRWLHAMRDQLRARMAAGPGEEEQRQIRAAAARCEQLVVRLRRLRAAAAVARQAREAAQSAVHHRTALARSVLQFATQHFKQWEGVVGPLASLASEGGAQDGQAQPAIAAHGELQQRIAQALAECVQLDAHEQALADQFDALSGQLQSED